MNELQKIESFRKDLAIVETIQEVKLHETTASAMATFAKANKISTDKQNELGRFRIEIEAKKGDILNEMFPKSVNAVSPMRTANITPRESSRARDIFREENLDNIMDVIEKGGSVITPNGVDIIIKKERKIEAKEAERTRLEEIGKTKKIDVDFRLGDFEDVFKDIPDGSIDCIITDPPYPKEFLNEWSKLSRVAKRVLKPNGYCVAYSGQMYLPEVLQRMSENLDYYWTFAVYHKGQTQIINGINLMCRWKPVLIFQNGKKKLQNTFQDYFISEQREKTAHDWQQSESGVAYLIEMFTNKGDTILEPFAGSGTTIIAGKSKGRNIIAAEIDEKTYNIAKALL